ncbi:uncharacterized protein [Panulirus ornatus]|uniref:uncharacterized protein n=1 Tax=Panulirus ornatus TaxID=150431 RepID=UPI003A8B5241
MSMGGRVVMGGMSCQMISLPYLPPQLPPPPAVGQAVTSHTSWPNALTSWSATITHRNLHPHHHSPYRTVSVSGAPVVSLLQKTGRSAPSDAHCHTVHCPTVPMPQLSRASFHVGYYVPPSVKPGDPYGGLQQVWKQHFELLFSNLPSLWSFGPMETTPVGWITFKDMAKVRFSCQHCSHGWTSMYGLVVFYYQWSPTTNQGYVRFLLTGQKCNHCSSGRFETPMWYPEEAQKVMTNLYHEVAGRIYKLRTPPLIKDRRHGRPRHEHNSHMCEGCHQGICKKPKMIPSSS